VGLSISGFILIAVGVILGFISSWYGNTRLDAAYLSSISGLVTNFIAAIGFVLYDKTLNQINKFHDKLMTTQHIAISLITANQIKDLSKKEPTFVDLSKTLMSK
jgi:uncharacterized membrane protein